MLSSLPTARILRAFVFLVAACAVAAPAQTAVIDISTRSASRAFYLAEYLPSNGVPIGWTGNIATCQPGTTSVAHRDAVLRRVNYFRAMAGVPAEITFNNLFNSRAQAAALMMSANNRLDHYPTLDWHCYSAEGATGASSSNLYLGVTGVPAIDGYIRDPGSNNASVGHRRWILNPTTREMGTGDISGNGARLANALYVIDSHFFDPKPTLRDEYIAWPPPGYVPHSIVYPRWHISLEDADFTNAAVTMTRNGTTISVDIESQGEGFRDEYLAWRVNDMGDYDSFPVPTSDVVFSVNISGALVGGLAHQFTYDVTMFNPSIADFLVGDYNRNGTIGADDYLTWRSTFGKTAAVGSEADGNGNGIIDASDYVVWRDRVSPGATATGLPVPEPTTSTILLAAVILFCVVADRHLLVFESRGTSKNCGPVTPIET